MKARNFLFCGKVYLGISFAYAMEPAENLDKDLMERVRELIVMEADIELIMSWKKYKRSIYVIIKYYPEYAVFFSMNTCKFYKVFALIDLFSELLPEELPLVVQAGFASL
jgi:hypothetical protein